MKSGNYNDVRQYTIYALTLDSKNGTRFVYLGKTTSPRLSAIYSRHICGNVEATNDYFDKDDNRPMLHKLEVLSCSAPEAHKHVLAWVHFFFNNSCIVLNHDSLISQACNLSPETEQIVNTICQESLDDILKRTYIERPSDADRHIPKPPASKSPRTQMNVRMYAKDKEKFNAFCKDMKLNQREAFSLLLDKTTEPQSTAHISQQIKEYQNKINELLKIFTVLKNKIDSLTSSPKPPSEIKATAQLKLVRQCISAYLPYIFLYKIYEEPLPVLSYKRFKESLPFGVKYDYPPEDGYMVLNPHALVWGKSRHVLFVIGTDGNENHIKLRYYPKDTFVGVSPLNKDHAYVGSSWIMGYKRANDGAMDIVLALPLPDNFGISSNYDISDIEADESDFSRSYVKDTKPVEISITDNPETHMKKPSLDSIIKHSELKNPKN